MVADPAQIPWLMVAEAVCGTDHEKTSRSCQDAFCVKVIPPDIFLAAVADGAGSAQSGEIGAQLSVQVALEILAAEIPHSDWSEPALQNMLSETMKKALQAIQNEASLREIEVRDLATTLILILTKPDLVAVGQIGDGAVVVADSHQTLTALTTPQHGEYINQTTFLTSPHALDKLQCAVWQGHLTHLAAFTDGLQMLALKMPEATPHQPFFKPLFNFLDSVEDSVQATQELNTFLTSQRIRERASDDLTLLLAKPIH